MLRFFHLHLRKDEAATPEGTAFVRVTVMPPAVPQYQSAKTRTLQSQSAAPERKRAAGDSLCAGSATTSRTTELIRPPVMMTLMSMPRA